MTITNIDRVKPGQLITSSLLNGLIDNLVDLQAQLLSLAGPSPSGAVEITDLSPAGDVTEVTTLTINGRNFAVPAVLNTVSFDSTTVGAFLPGSNDTQLLIDVPGGMPNVPGDKTLTVETPQNGTATRTVHVVSAPVPLTGKVLVSDHTGSLGTIAVNTPYTFQFELDGVNLNISEMFRVHAVYSGVVGGSSADWDAGTSYIGTTGSLHEVTVDANTKVSFGVVVTVPPNAQQADMHVEIVSLHNDPTSSNSTQSIPIKVGATQGTSSGAVTFTFGQQSGNFVAVVPVGTENGLQVKLGKSPIVQMNATYNVGGTYVYDPLQIETDAGPETGVWSADSLVPSPLPHTPGESEALQFKIHAPATAPTDGVQRYLRITATRQENTSPGQLKSYYRFPIIAF